MGGATTHFGGHPSLTHRQMSGPRDGTVVKPAQALRVPFTGQRKGIPKGTPPFVPGGASLVQHMPNLKGRRTERET